MKYSYLSLTTIILCLFLTNLTRGQVNNHFRIEGRIDGLTSGSTVYLIQNSTNDTVSKATAIRSSFVLNGNVPKGTEYYFIRLDTSISKGRSSEFLLENTTQQIKGSLSTWPSLSLTGSTSNDEYNNLAKLWHSLKNRYDSIRRNIILTNQNINALKSKVDSSKLLRLIENKSQLQKEFANHKNYRRDQIRRFIMSNPNSLYIPDLIRRIESEFTFSEKSEFYNHLTMKSRESYFGELLKAYLDIAKAQQQVAENTIIPDFYVHLPEKRSINIKEIAATSKLTLIDFWASWCGPCREQFPHLKRIYNEFHPLGLNIIGISIHDSESEWKKALKGDNLPWINGLDRDKNIASLFDIIQVPSYILIDNSGRIISFKCNGSSIPSFGPPITGDGLLETLRSTLK